MVDLNNLLRLRQYTTHDWWASVDLNFWIADSEPV